MRVQLQGQHLRLRLQEDELRQLLDGGTVENRTTLPDGRRITQQVHLAQAIAWHAQTMTWRIALPAMDVRAYAGRLPTREGLDYTLATPEGEPLALRFDVDVRDSARRRHARPDASGG